MKISFNNRFFRWWDIKKKYFDHTVIFLAKKDAIWPKKSFFSKVPHKTNICNFFRMLTLGKLFWGLKSGHNSSIVREQIMVGSNIKIIFLMSHPLKIHFYRFLSWKYTIFSKPEVFDFTVRCFWVPRCVWTAGFMSFVWTNSFFNKRTLRDWLCL